MPQAPMSNSAGMAQPDNGSTPNTAAVVGQQIQQKGKPGQKPGQVGAVPAGKAGGEIVISRAESAALAVFETEPEARAMRRASAESGLTHNQLQTLKARADRARRGGFTLKGTNLILKPTNHPEETETNGLLRDSDGDGIDDETNEPLTAAEKKAEASKKAAKDAKHASKNAGAAKKAAKPAAKVVKKAREADTDPMAEEIDTITEVAIYNLADEDFTALIEKWSDAAKKAAVAARAARGLKEFNPNHSPTDGKFTTGSGGGGGSREQGSTGSKRVGRQYSLEQFQDKTALLPHVIADRVSGGDRKFADYAADRTVRLYNNNPDWRKKMDAKSGRDTLYTFTQHWHEGWKKDGGSRMMAQKASAENGRAPGTGRKVVLDPTMRDTSKPLGSPTNPLKVTANTGGKYAWAKGGKVAAALNPKGYGVYIPEKSFGPSVKDKMKAYRDSESAAFKARQSKQYGGKAKTLKSPDLSWAKTIKNRTKK